MNVQVRKVTRADGKKWCVQIVFIENGKERIQNKKSYPLNEKKKAIALKIKLQNQDTIEP